MREIILRIIEIASSGFWAFVGFMMVLTLVLKSILLGWSRFLRHLNIRKYGYPPPHCDADGDLAVKDEATND